MPLNEQQGYTRKVDGVFVRSSPLNTSPPSRLTLAREIGRLEGENETLRAERDRLNGKVEFLSEERRRVVARLSGEKVFAGQNGFVRPSDDPTSTDLEEKAKSVYEKWRVVDDRLDQRNGELERMRAFAEAAQKERDDLRAAASICLEALKLGGSLTWLPTAKTYYIGGVEAATPEEACAIYVAKAKEAAGVQA